MDLSKYAQFFAALFVTHLSNYAHFFCSALQPIFQKNNVRLIGVGLEELGVQEFIDGKFFDGGTMTCSFVA